MNLARQTYIYYVFVLKEYMVRIAECHYPKEIIGLVVMCTYESPKIFCEYNHTLLIILKSHIPCRASVHLLLK